MDNTACAAQTLLPACFVTKLAGLSNISSESSTFLLTGKQCITFALLERLSDFAVNIHAGSVEKTLP
jgi:hypothetical protein